MKLLSLAMVFFLVAFALTADANAQRRGGGRSFSAGGSRSLPSGGMNRSSRSSDFNRGGNQSFGGSSFGNLNNRQPSSNTRSFSMPNSFPTSGNNAGNRRSEPRSLNQERLGGNFNNGLTDRANRQFESPTQNQLNDFLNMPGTSTGRQRNGGNSSPNDYNGKTYQGDNYTIDTYKGGGSGTTKGGVDYGGAAGGIVVTDAQGNKRVVGGSVGAASDGTNAVAGRGGTQEERIRMVPLLELEVARALLPTASRSEHQEQLLAVLGMLRGMCVVELPAAILGLTGIRSSRGQGRHVGNPMWMVQGVTLHVAVEWQPTEQTRLSSVAVPREFEIQMETLVVLAWAACGPPMDITLMLEAGQRGM